jgi:hypothetical protein
LVASSMLCRWAQVTKGVTGITIYGGWWICAAWSFYSLPPLPALLPPAVPGVPWLAPARPVFPALPGSAGAPGWCALAGLAAVCGSLVSAGVPWPLGGSSRAVCGSGGPPAGWCALAAGWCALAGGRPRPARLLAAARPAVGSGVPGGPWPAPGWFRLVPRLLPPGGAPLVPRGALTPQTEQLGALPDVLGGIAMIASSMLCRWAQVTRGVTGMVNVPQWDWYLYPSMGLADGARTLCLGVRWPAGVGPRPRWRRVRGLPIMI